MENASKATLMLLLAEGHEHERLDFKEMFTAEDKDAWAEIAKDVGAMQVDGGHIVLGAHDDGTPSGKLTEAQARLLDESVVRSKLRRWVSEPFKVRAAAYDVAGSWVGIIYVAPNPDGFGVFQHDASSGPKPPSFRSGDVFARHGTASERWRQSDIARIKGNLRRRADDESRQHVLAMAIPKSRQVAGQVTAIPIDPAATTESQVQQLCGAAAPYGRGNSILQWSADGNHQYATVLQVMANWRARSQKFYGEMVPLFPFLEGEHIRLLNDLSQNSYFTMLDGMMNIPMNNSNLSVLAEPIWKYAVRGRALQSYVNALAAAPGTTPSASAVVNIGNEEQATRLFAYPNQGHESDSLEETILHYLKDSIAREGLLAGQVAVSVSSAGCTATISGLDPDQATAVRDRYQAFFDNCIVGLAGADAFQASGKMDAGWTFLVPLGIPLAYAAAVEVMDFPPLTLIQNQDYLRSKTTSRWWELLQLNGVAAADLARFSCILDIAPIAAPARDGSKLDASGIYTGPFDSYDTSQLELMSRTDDPAIRRPLIALGLPIRTWIQRVWAKTMAIMDVGTLPLPAGGSCPIIASNHPSFFYYAVHSNTGPDAAQKNLAAGLAVMRQDVVAAAWHAEMGRTPSVDPHTVLAASQAKWQGRDAELLALVKKQAAIPALFALEPVAASMPTINALQPNPQQLADLEKKFFDARNSGHMGEDR